MLFLLPRGATKLRMFNIVMLMIDYNGEIVSIS